MTGPADFSANPVAYSIPLDEAIERHAVLTCKGCEWFPLSLPTSIIQGLCCYCRKDHSECGTMEFRG